MAKTQIPCKWPTKPEYVKFRDRTKAAKKKPGDLENCHLEIRVPPEASGWSNALIKCAGTCKKSKTVDVCDVIKEDVTSADGKKRKRVRCACTDKSKECSMEVVLIYDDEDSPVIEKVECSTAECIGVGESCQLQNWAGDYDGKKQGVFFCDCVGS
jgi:hypothetical protein